MRGGIPPLHQYAFMTWCSVKAQGPTFTVLPLHAATVVGRAADFSVCMQQKRLNKSNDTALGIRIPVSQGLFADSCVREK
jgi:hypothetical protein